jgi:hypothetical protein
LTRDGRFFIRAPIAWRKKMKKVVWGSLTIASVLVTIAPAGDARAAASVASGYAYLGEEASLGACDLLAGDSGYGLATFGGEIAVAGPFGTTLEWDPYACFGSDPLPVPIPVPPPPPPGGRQAFCLWLHDSADGSDPRAACAERIMSAYPDADCAPAANALFPRLRCYASESSFQLGLFNCVEQVNDNDPSSGCW